MQNALLQYARPIFWMKADGKGVSSGTTFFLDCGLGVFGVTAGHVYDEYLAAASPSGVKAQIGFGNTMLFDLRGRLIARGRNVDIATYRVTAAEVGAIGASMLTGSQDSWPPKPPERDRGVLYGGYPGIARRSLGLAGFEFGSFTASGVATSITNDDIVSVIERENLSPTLGLALPPDDCDLAGISGAPMLTVVTSAILTWRLAGVVYTSVRGIGEIVMAARADFIAADGQIVEPD